MRKPYNNLVIHFDNSGVYVNEQTGRSDSKGNVLPYIRAWFRVSRATSNVKILAIPRTSSVQIEDTNSGAVVGVIDNDFYNNGGLDTSLELVKEARKAKETKDFIFLKTAEAALTELIQDKAVLRK